MRKEEPGGLCPGCSGESFRRGCSRSKTRSLSRFVATKKLWQKFRLSRLARPPPLPSPTRGGGRRLRADLGAEAWVGWDQGVDVAETLVAAVEQVGGRDGE